MKKWPVLKKKGVSLTILSELRSKEFNVLSHVLKMSSNSENPDKIGDVVRSCLIKDMTFL